MTRPPCDHSGAVAVHHPDYLRPVEVCPDCCRMRRQGRRGPLARWERADWYAEAIAGGIRARRAAEAFARWFPATVRGAE